MSRLSRIPNVDDVPMDPAMAAELAALDAALRGDAIADESLAALVRDVKAQAPVMPSELREGLRDDVAAGFPRKGSARRRRETAVTAPGRPAPRRPKSNRRLALAYGSGFAVMVLFAISIAGVAINGSGSDDAAISDASQAVSGLERQIDSAPAPASAGSQSSATEELSQASSAAAPEALADSTAAGDASTARRGASSPAKSSTPASGKRRVERSVDMTVRVKSGELSEAAGKVGDITRQAGGFVADSRVSARSRGAGSATFTLQVASSKLDAAIGRLSDLGTVTSQEQASTDITSSFDSVQQRLDDAKAVRRALLRSLDRADGAGQIASLRSRIADNRKTIAGLESSKLALERRTNLTTIALTLRAPSGDAPAADEDGSWSLGDAAGDAVGLLGAITGGLLVAAAALLPFGLLAAIGWAIYRVRRRRARDAALDD